MGNLQSVLGDCQLGEVPAYLQQYVSKADGGDEAYMVYGDRLHFKQQQDPGCYSGPSQTHVRSNLLKENDISERQMLSDLVDLCVDGIDSAGTRDRQLGSSRTPGGATFSMPKGSKGRLNMEVWDEAEYESKESGGPIRATPDGVERVKTTKSKEDRKKKKHKSKKKSRKDRKVDECIEEIVESYPDDLQDLLRENDTREEGNNAAPVEEESQEDEAYHSEIEAENDPSPSSTERVVVDTLAVSNSTASTKPPKSPKRKNATEGVALNVYRDEEAKLLERLVIVVHPSEEPEEPIGEWYLLDAEWFREWSAFLRGAVRPGRILNSKLLDRVTGEPWAGQEPGKHYVGLDVVAWNLLRDIYGSDIEIVRPAFNIYAK
mmetsp:Transcript_9259/g.15034  ORF Transcript_9259/g.15034 Transcript_9259/m.15034 type:complete len:376 (-) Transcript_9259:1951-3078(-)|eukprot:CAMPEP_0203749962 /NCGR_PEP_ID=MMETSP0098-20131031/4302_1 /ASSEMBLY_ACC=CAM_ASM_000208 /TAXON_ID=96639 /ORGANISM=" , Strain NY0313808BC1" /LENGTH=375 /DNA_ID=CAMNT_0050639085 /DNA_START=302 /DNA_END=1429 /DNA_ORIENTATION=+